LGALHVGTAGLIAIGAETVFDYTLQPSHPLRSPDLKRGWPLAQDGLHLDNASKAAAVDDR
jgi:hypothetical protein